MPEKLKKGWRTWHFDQIAVMVNNRIDNPSEAGVDRYVGLEHLDSDSLTIRRWGSPSDVEATKLRFRAGDIIFGRRRVYQRKLGVPNFDGICSAHAMVLRPRPEAGHKGQTHCRHSRFPWHFARKFLNRRKQRKRRRSGSPVHLVVLRETGVRESGTARYAQKREPFTDDSRRRFLQARRAPEWQPEICQARSLRALCMATVKDYGCQSLSAGDLIPQPERKSIGNP